MLHFATRPFIGLLLLTSLLLPAASGAITADESRLVIGRISSQPNKHYERLRVMGDYLLKELSPHGIKAIDIVIVPKPERMEELLAAGQVDIFSETPFTALDLVDKGLAEILMREWKKGVPEYHSIIVARKDGPVHRLEDLAGRRFAFEDAGSSSGYLMPRVALEQAGMTLRELSGPQDTVRPGEVGYSFTKDEVNVVSWVHRGRADAGALSNLDWNSERAAPAHFKKDLQIIHRTEPITRSLILARTGLDDTTKQRIAAVLETMHESAAGQAVLKKYFRVARYDRMEGDALAGLENARRLRKSVTGPTN